jgi:hypothetical protein
MKLYRTDWKKFLKTVIDRGLGDATSHHMYEAAKVGDVESAYILAKDLVSDEAIAELEKIIDGQYTIIVPVHAEEAVGRNMIPLATSAVIAKKLFSN